MPYYGPDLGVLLAASNTTWATDTVVLSGTGGVVVSTTGTTIRIGPAPMSFWQNYPLASGQAMQTINLTASTRSLFISPLAGPDFNGFPGDMTVSTMRILLSGSGSTASMSNQHSVGFSFGLYILSGSASQSTLSLVNSVGSSWTNTTLATSAGANLYNGIRFLSIHSSQWSSQPVLSQGVSYFLGRVSSWSSISFNTLAMYGGSVAASGNVSGFFNAASATNTSRGFHPVAGVYTVTTTGMPASIHLTQLSKTQGSANIVPWVEFDNLWSSR